MKKVTDERIQKKNNRIAAQLLPLMLALQVIVLAVKLALGGWGYCLLDVLALAAGVGVTVALRAKHGVWRAEDEALREIADGCRAMGFGVMLQVLVFGEFVCMLADGAHLAWYVPSLPVWGIPALIFTVRGMRGGLLVWGTRRNEAAGQKRLAISTAVGALFFGVVTGGHACFEGGVFQPAGLWKVLGMGASWGILFYLMFTLLMRFSKKMADKEVPVDGEEQAHEDRQA